MTMEVKDIPKGRIKKFEYMVVIDGEYYDVYSVRRKTGKINIGYGRGTFWADIENIDKFVKNE
jgi:hypothetical protein